MYERTEKLPRGTVANAPRVLGARWVPDSCRFVLERPVPIQTVRVPMAKSNITVTNRLRQLASDQANVAMLG